MKKLIIIGAGVAGLTAGIYGRLNGFETEIYELHSIPGGECTGWRRKGYYIDGCIHWLVGSKAGTPLNRIWREVGALDDSVGIINTDIFYCLEEDGQSISLYRDLEKLETELKRVSPEDSEKITELCKTVKAMKHFTMPTEKPFDKMNALDMVKFMFSIMPALKYVPKLQKMTIEEYVSQFRSPLLRKALQLLIPPYFTAISLVSTMASLADGDSGWPEGGSLAIPKRMEKRYLELGGKIYYNSRVKKILTDNGRATGILLEDGRTCTGDYVISTADGHATIFELLEGKYLSEEVKTLYSDNKSYPVYTSVQVALGVDCDLSQHPHVKYVNLENKIYSGGAENSCIGIKHHCYDKTLNPPGKSTVIVMLNADFDWWKAKYEDKAAYRAEKERIGAEVVAAVEKCYPEVQGKIEMIDVATPMTYVRYCNAWQGAWMAFASTPTGKIRYLPGNLPGLEGFYLSGQWTMPPGGLPTALITSRWLIQRIKKG